MNLLCPVGLLSTKLAQSAVILLGISLVLTGCLTDPQANRIDTEATAEGSPDVEAVAEGLPETVVTAEGRLEVYTGTVLSVKEATNETEEIGITNLKGNLLGELVVSTFGAGDGRSLATSGGVIAGAAAGSAFERATGRNKTLELEVELDDGRIMVVVQRKDDEFAVGDRVRLLETEEGGFRARQ